LLPNCSSLSLRCHGFERLSFNSDPIQKQTNPPKK
jgi:hypothetical protein